MSNTPDIWSVLRGLDVDDDKLLQHPAFEQLPALLENDEAPECVARNGDADVYVATDRRIIHFKTDFWKKSISKVTPYLYNDIKTFQAEMAFASIGCRMTINGDVKTLPMKKGDRQRFATVVRSHVSAHQTDESISGQAAQPATSQPPSAEKKSKMPIGGCAIMIVLAGLVIGGIAWGIGSCSGGPPSEEKLEESRSSTPKQQPTNSRASSQPMPAQGMAEVNSIVDRISPDGIRNGSLRGVVSNHAGQDCWFGQVATDDNSVSYFYEKLTGSDTLLIFDNQRCMETEVPGLMALQQSMVNQAISTWYSLPDAKFMVSPDQLYRKSQLQVKGWCIQSATYPLQAIAVDYFVDGESLVAVVHSYAVGGCQN